MGVSYYLGVFGYCTRYAESIGLPMGDCHYVVRLQAFMSRCLTEKCLTEKREGSAIKPSLLDICFTARKETYRSKRPNLCLLGISQELDMTVPSPDYSHPLSRIYATTTVACFTNNLSIEFFHTSPRIAGELDCLHGQ